MSDLVVGFSREDYEKMLDEEGEGKGMLEAKTPGDDAIDIGYPSKAFEIDGFEKPVVSIIDIKEGVYKLGNTLHVNLHEGKATEKLITTFLYHAAALFMDSLSENWESFDREIGKSNTIITPQSLVSAVVDESAKADLIEGTLSVDQVIKLVHLIFFATRLNTINSANRTEYRTKISDYMTATLNDIPTQLEVNVGSCSSIFRKLPTIANFTKIMAAYDMFMFKFPMNVHSKLRIGTCMVRDKDCGALSLMKYALRFLGNLRVAKMASWMIHELLVLEFKRMFKSGEEIKDLHSYAHYGSGFNLFLKSPYSTSVNSCTYFVFASVVSLGGLKRGSHARMSLDVGLNQMETVVKIMALAFRKGANLAATLATTAAHMQRGVVYSKPTGQGMDGTPNTTDAWDWIDWFASKGWTIPPAQEEIIADMARRCINDRPDTIGWYWHNKYRYINHT